MNDPIIQLKEVRKSYGLRLILDRLSLSVPEGSVFGLLGKNGAGKTTLIKTILGLLKPQEGDVYTFRDNPWDFKEATKEKIGYVPQSDVMYPWLKIKEIIAYSASFYSHWNSELVDQLLKEWELDADDKIGLLSEGQAQKLSIILSLGHEPELLIFDEPVASLDPYARRQFLKTILNLVSNRSCTIFFSTHITSDLERVADHVALLKDGNIDFSGELDRLKDEVKRLHVTFRKDFNNDFNFKGLLHFESLKNEAIFSVRSFTPGMKTFIEEKLNAKVTVQDLNLEEIFLELTR
ncbi:MAG: ABC transporter ATP-binding protein [Candidatus Omnitrophica bacterium]|nr:ABC transporter ATP-binding protein [Candidatus Omnitrophota bacterium]